jgi:hypothetical protein
MKLFIGIEIRILRIIKNRIELYLKLNKFLNNNTIVK